MVPQSSLHNRRWAAGAAIAGKARAAMQRASIWRIMPILPLRLCVRVATALKLVNRSRLESTRRSFIGGLEHSEKTRTKSNLKQLGHGIGRILHLDPERHVFCIVQICLQNPHDLLNCPRFISMVLMCPRSLFQSQCKFSADVQRRRGLEQGMANPLLPATV